MNYVVALRVILAVDGGVPGMVLYVPYGQSGKFI